MVYFPAWIRCKLVALYSSYPARSFYRQMFVFLVTLAGSTLLQSACVVTKGESTRTFTLFMLCEAEHFMSRVS